MILFEKKNEKGEIVSRSTDPNVSYIRLKKREVNTATGPVILYTDDEDLKKSSRLFNKLANGIAGFIDAINDYFLHHIEVHLHSLKKIHAQLLGKIESVVSNPVLAHAPTYADQKKAVLDYISKYPEKSAEAILYLQKRIIELGAHMDSFELLHMGKHIHIVKQQHNIKLLVLAMWHGFDEVTQSRGLSCEFISDDSVSFHNKILLDYKTINVAFYNFFDNAIKYMKPNSSIKCFLEVNGETYRLTMKMHSLKIEKAELESVFMLGYRGINVKHTGDGTGVGLYIIKKALGFNGASIVIEPDYSNVIVENKKEFILNKFIINGPIKGAK